MERRAVSGRGEPIPSILKNSKKHRAGDLVDKSTKIKREKNSSKKDDVNIPLPQGCTPLMYACQQANYKSVVETLNKDVSFLLTTISRRIVVVLKITLTFYLNRAKICFIKFVDFWCDIKYLFDDIN